MPMEWEADEQSTLTKRGCTEFVAGSKRYKSPNPAAYVFIYGTPRVNERNERYAIIDITNLDMIDICVEAPWTKCT